MASPSLWLWSGIVTFVILKVIGAMVPLRVRHEDEVMGLDVTQHGEALAVARKSGRTRRRGGRGFTAPDG